ncbi:hypothetical protein FACS1894187_03810 [Synergistales bacterium]|nr:hypothetical protein FACS1894187_03810 [Synergistales bacterium]
MEMITVSAKEQITIPALFRKRYGIKAGDKVLTEGHDTGFFIKKPVDIFAFGGIFIGYPYP